MICNKVCRSEGNKEGKGGGGVGGEGRNPGQVLNRPADHFAADWLVRAGCSKEQVRNSFKRFTFIF